MNPKVDLRKWDYNGNNFICQKDGWYLSYNDKHINNDNAPELAIAGHPNGMGILYYANPADYENCKTLQEALELGSKQCDDEESPVRAGFWTGYDFHNKTWFSFAKEEDDVE